LKNTQRLNSLLKNLFLTAIVRQRLKPGLIRKHLRHR
jgi:hypothetical protein